MAIELSKEQDFVKHHLDGALLVLASAGSGKTRVLTERIKYLLESHEGRFHILALTYTNKAAHEMKLRLEGVKDLKERAFIGTIHGFCIEIIEKQGYAIGLTKIPHIFERDDDRRSLLVQVFENNPGLKKYYKSLGSKEQQTFIYNALNYISQQKKNLKGVRKVELTTDNNKEDEALMMMYNEYNDLLNNQNAMDFDDVILFAYKIFVERPEIAKLYRKLYKYISIDEAQDLNYAQYEFIRLLCNGEHKNVLMVGDSNQSIFSFNGSDVKFMKDYFLKDFQAKTVSLNTNYRSSKVVIKAANSIKPDSMVGIISDKEGEFQINPCETEEEEAIFVVNKIKEFLKSKIHKDIEGIITTENIAILARHRYVFHAVEKVLLAEELPFFYKKGNDTPVFDSDLVNLFDLGLRIITNPQDLLHYGEIFKLLKIEEKIDGYKNEDGLTRLKNIATKIDGDIKNDFYKLIDAWELVEKDINKFSAALGILEALSEQKSIENERIKILSDINVFKDLWKSYSRSASLDSKSLQNFKTQTALGITNSNQNQTGITLGTIHSVKGLEYDIVFIIGMNQGVFPDYRAVNSGGKFMDEEKNSIYVALTRSERLLYITYPKKKFMPWDKETPKAQHPSVFIKSLESIL